MSVFSLFRLSISYSKGHALQKFLLFLGIAIGVAVVVAIDLANESIGRSFQLSTKSITGKATHQIVGSRGELEQAFYSRLRTQIGIRQIAPVITGYIQVAEFDQRTFRLLGVDPFVEADFRNYFGSVSGVPSQALLSSILTQPNRVLISEELAAEHRLKPGDSITLQTAKGEVQVIITALLESDNSFTRQALSGVVLTDIATAQEILQMGNRISYIDLKLEPGDDSTLEKITALLPSGSSIVTSERNNQSIRQMSKSFEINLKAMSLLALLVGMFLIYNTITFSVVQRWFQLGTLRALGITRREVFAIILGESFFWGLLGSISGILLGIALGTGVVKMVSQTISDLYFTLTVNTFYLSIPQLIKAFLLGLVASVVSAAFPAWEAAHLNPVDALRRATLEKKFSSNILLFSISGVALIVVGYLLLLLPSRELIIGFAALLAIVFGSGLLVPAVTLILMRILRIFSILFSGIIGRMASRNIGRSLSRTGISIASLMIAVSVIVGVGTMVGSFRTTVVTWLSNTIRADLYIRPANHLGREFDQELKARLAEVPGVKRVNSIRSHQIRFGPYTNSFIISLDQDTAKRAWIWKIADQKELENLWDQGWVYVSEPFAWKHQIRGSPGSSIKLQTDKGLKEFKLAGIFRDFSSEQGVVIIKDHVYQQYWHDRTLFGISLFLKKEADLEQTRKLIESQLGSRYGMLIRSDKGLRESAIEVFDRTFTITIALQILAGLVAFIGVLNAVMSIMLERSREIGILRANGLTIAQLWKLVLTESGLIGLLAGIYAIPLGTTMAWILVFIINKRSFGWTLDFVYQPETYFQAVVIAIVAALLAGIYPVVATIKKPVAELLRTE